MGQKTNPNILRLGVTKNWKTEFFEKKKKELPLYIFKDLEIHEYIERFLEIKGVLVHDYRQYYNDNTLNLYISYFVTSKSNFHVSGKNQKLFLSNSDGVVKSVNSLSLPSIKKEKVIEKFDAHFINPKEMYVLRKYLKVVNLDVHTAVSSFNFGTSINNSLKNMLKVISNFTLNKFNIVINFSCINKDFGYLSILKTKKIKMLQKFRSASFFKDGIELLFHAAFNKNSARLLAKFVASQLKISKRPNFFLRFIKQTLSILITSKMSVLRGVKIILRGRLSKGPRAKQKILTVGDVPVQSFNCNIDYFQLTTHNSNGSYGIKIWVVEK